MLLIMLNVSELQLESSSLNNSGNYMYHKL
jgi:hypothetical protein